MNKSITWFLDRVGQTVLRDKKKITINNEKEARYHYSLQSHFTYNEPVTVHISSEPQYCESYQG